MPKPKTPFKDTHKKFICATCGKEIKEGEKKYKELGQEYKHEKCYFME